MDDVMQQLLDDAGPQPLQTAISIILPHFLQSPAKYGI